MTAAPEIRHSHCPNCGKDYDGMRALCTDCILKEHEEITAEVAKGAHEPEPEANEDHEPEHEAEAQP